MAGFGYEEAPSVLDLPERHEAVAAFGIGYVGDPVGAPEALKERDTTKRQRHSAKKLIHIGTWGEYWNG